MSASDPRSAIGEGQITPEMSGMLEQLVSAAEADGWGIFVLDGALWYRFPTVPRPDDRPDAIERLNIERENPAVRAALVPFLRATGRVLPSHAPE